MAGREWNWDRKTAKSRQPEKPRGGKDKKVSKPDPIPPSEAGIEHSSYKGMKGSRKG